MSLYNKGVHTRTILGSTADHYIERASSLYDGGSMFHRGGTRFYNRGINPHNAMLFKSRSKLGHEVGAVMGGQAGSLVDGIVAFLLDASHVLLLLGGCWLMWRAVFG